MLFINDNDLKEAMISINTEDFKKFITWAIMDEAISHVNKHFGFNHEENLVQHNTLEKLNFVGVSPFKVNVKNFNGRKLHIGNLTVILEHIPENKELVDKMCEALSKAIAFSDVRIGALLEEIVDVPVFKSGILLGDEYYLINGEGVPSANKVQIIALSGFTARVYHFAEQSSKDVDIGCLATYDELIHFNQISPAQNLYQRKKSEFVERFFLFRETINVQP